MQEKENQPKIERERERERNNLLFVGKTMQIMEERMTNL